MIIKELILKNNMVIPGYPLKFYAGLSTSITDRTEDGDITKNYFVNEIKHYSKNSSFVEERGLSFGCYVISIAGSNEDFCLKNNSKESCMVMEDAVAMVLFTN